MAGGIFRIEVLIMARPLNVGRSSRTPVKHMILDRMVGKIVGVLSTKSMNVPCKANPFLVVDLCGGDGVVTEHHDASPQILHRHCQWLIERKSNARLMVFEQSPHSFELLDSNTAFVPGRDQWFTIHNQDSRLFVMPKMLSNQAAFVHCDPNCVDQTPLTQPFLSSWNSHTTYLVTLGCNVGGAKRVSLEDRKKWFWYVESLCEVLPKNHDAVLFWLEGDASQWAYLLSIPKVWSRGFSKKIVDKAGSWWPNGLGMASYRDHQSDFVFNINRLFLTEKELNNASRA